MFVALGALHCKRPRAIYTLNFYTIYHYRYDGVGPSDTTYAMLHGEGPAVRGAAAALAACKPLADLLARAHGHVLE